MATISDRMKSFAAVLAICILGSTAARASSFVEPEELDATLGPSMVALGDEAVATMDEESPSIIALQSDSEPQTVVAGLQNAQSPHGIDAEVERDSTVSFVSISPSIVATEPAFVGIDEARTAAIDNDNGVRQQPPHFKPMVIRGGLVGDSYAQSLPRSSAAADRSDTGASPPAGFVPRGSPRPGNGPDHGPENAPEAPPPGLRPKLSKPQ